MLPLILLPQKYLCPTHKTIDGEIQYRATEFTSGALPLFLTHPLCISNTSIHLSLDLPMQVNSLFPRLLCIYGRTYLLSSSLVWLRIPTGIRYLALELGTATTFPRRASFSVLLTLNSIEPKLDYHSLKFALPDCMATFPYA